MELRWTDLDDDERSRVEEAFTIARGRERLMYRRIAGRDEEDLIGELEKFARSIDGLSREAKDLLGPLREDAISGQAKPSNALEQVRHQLEFLISCHEGRPGAPRHYAREEAAGELKRIWIDRGGNPAIGQTRREKNGSNFHPSSFLEFVADALLKLDPTLKHKSNAVSAAETALRP